jgi:hypothetical protein
MATMAVITHGDAAKMEEVGDANPPLVTQTPAATILAPLISKTYDRQVPPEISGSSKVPRSYHHFFEILLNHHFFLNFLAISNFL